MENFGSLPTNLHHQELQASKYRATMANKPIKVKYISSPMMVKANNETEFRAIVQKLTGQHSADHDAFDQPPEQFSHGFYPPPSAAASFQPKDCCGLVSGDVYDPIGVGKDRDWRGEMNDSFSGFQAPYVDVWR